MGIGKALVQMCCEVATEVAFCELMAISASDEMFKACRFAEFSVFRLKRDGVAVSKGDDLSLPDKARSLRSVVNIQAD